MSVDELVDAALKGDANAVFAALDAGADIDGVGKRDLTPLMAAILGKGQEVVAPELIRRGASFAHRQASSGWRAITFAAVNDHVDLLGQLLDAGDELGADDWKALHYAAQYRSRNTLPIVLARGQIPIDSQDDAGVTALMRAAKNSDTDTVEVLLEHGASLDVRDEEGRIALHYAAERANVRNIELLGAEGNRTAAEDNRGITPLAIAQTKNRPRIIAALRSLSGSD